MSLKVLLMSFGFSEIEAEEMVEKNLPRYRANVAYYENMRDLSRFESVADLEES